MRRSLLLLPALLLGLVAALAQAADTPPAQALPKLPPLPAPVRIGDAAPDFELKDINGQPVRLSELTAQGKVVVLEWFSPACPMCVAYYSGKPAEGGAPAQEAPMPRLHAAIDGPDLAWICINSAAPGNPGSALDENQKAVADMSIKFPLLFDPSGRVGMAYGAKRTPTIAVIDLKGRLIYRGCADDGGHDNPGGGRSFVGEAVQAARNGEMPMVLETSSFG